ncbi:glycosyltransferase family 39 protein [Oceanibacterium hippocampi]|uniref:Glycosyltransferase RgtA/B/C/D-like domain-containing protein n=1 Tax=Oceanibacterium hippocampi TaxID=745714 RepID=A0A1Y5S1J8_9PROT|nr:glycosyltransferase family 39 protein [Oceanibacterium hippocampi]SLN30505.1 hypothetical protein OCH7691_01066 [Oceanibacterium hippocampi]
MELRGDLRLHLEGKTLSAETTGTARPAARVGRLLLDRPFILFAMILAGGLAARAVMIGIGLWRDEGSTYFDAMAGGFSDLLATVAWSELNPPGFYLLMRGWIELAGAGEIAMKIPATLFGLLLLPALYCLARAGASGRVATAGGLLAAFWAATAPEMIIYSHEARPYSLSALLVIATVAAFIRAATVGSAGRWALFTLAATALLYVQYTGVILLAVLAGVAVGLRLARIGAPDLGRMAIAGAAICLLFAPWFPIFLDHYRTGLPWSESLDLAARPRLLLDNLAYMLPWAGDWVRVAAALLLLVLAGEAFRLLLRLRRRTPAETAPAEVALAALHLGGLGTLVADATIGHSGAYTLPFAPILVAYFAVRGTRALAGLPLPVSVRAPGLLALAAVGALALAWPGLQYVKQTRGMAQSGIRSFAASLDDVTLRQSLIVLAPDYLGPTFGYYMRNRPASYRGFTRWTHPEIFTPIDYAEIWDETDTVSEAMARIEALAPRFRTLLFVLDMRVDGPSGQMHYEHSLELRDALGKRYALEAVERHAGRMETVEVRRFDLHGAVRSP